MPLLPFVLSNLFHLPFIEEEVCTRYDSIKHMAISVGAYAYIKQGKAPGFPLRLWYMSSLLR